MATQARSFATPPVALLIWLLCVCCLRSAATVAGPAQHRIRDYTITVVPRGGTDPIPQWAVYDDTVRRSGTRSAASDYDDNSVFDPIENFTMPYYQLENASWYIGSNGFVSPLASAMCAQFCSGLSSRDWSSGYYKLYPSIPDGGGDWPSVQLYTYDLDPTNAGSGAIYKRVYDKAYAGSNAPVRVAVVEFYTIRPYSVAGTIFQNLTAQVELWANGTVVLRYASVFDWQAMIVSPYDIYPPTVGLAWTKLQRYFAYAYTRAGPATYPMALRLDPVLDDCNAFANCGACVVSGANASSPLAGRCTWVGPQQLCVSTAIAADYCAASQQNECVLPEVADAQRYYTLRQYDDRRVATNGSATNVGPAPAYDFFGPNASAAGLTPLTNVSWTTGAVNGSSPPFNIALPFDFPAFYNPPVFNQSDPLVLRNVFLSYFGTLSLLSPNVACEYLSYCHNGAYNYDLLGVSTYNVLLTGTTQYAYGQLPARGVNETLCGIDGATVSMAGTWQCPPAVFVRVERLLKYWHGSFSPSTAPQRWSYIMLVDSLGRIAVQYLDNNPAAVPEYKSVAPGRQPSPLASYPPPHVGLIRNGTTDGSSVSVPWSSVTDRTTLVFLPQPTCASCGGGGRCNRTSRLCVCLTGFAGHACAECAPGYFGPECTPCRNCGLHGQCNDGRSGSGSCSCSAPYSGANCSVECKAPPYTCSGCNDIGGYCECGQCVCYAARGWGGPNCTTWQDPCYAWSLDGCPVCTAVHSPVRCRYCPATAVCFADPSQSGIGTDNFTFRTCSTSLTVNDTDCVDVVQGQPLTGILAVIVVVMTFGLLGGAVCVFLLAICICRKRRENLLAARAITGTPNFHFVVREREVVQMVRLQKQGQRGMPVQGIPLRQMPMKDLYAFQQSKRMQNDHRNVRDWALLREDDA